MVTDAFKTRFLKALSKHNDVNPHKRLSQSSFIKQKMSDFIEETEAITMKKQSLEAA